MSIKRIREPGRPEPNTLENFKTEIHGLVPELKNLTEEKLDEILEDRFNEILENRSNIKESIEIVLFDLCENIMLKYGEILVGHGKIQEKLVKDALKDIMKILEI